MSDTDQHEMYLVATRPSGEEEWRCPTCGRRFLLRWPPAYQKTIIDPGDEYAIHSGSKGDLRMGGFDVDQDGQPLADGLLERAALVMPEADQGPIGASWEADEVEPTAPPADDLQPWLRWLHGADLGDQ